MSNTQERIRKRREYLKKKRAAYTEFGIAYLLVIPCVVFEVILVCAFVISMLDYFTKQPSEAPMASQVIGGAAAMLLFGWMTWILARAARRAEKRAVQLPYVPPVTADTLPAEEVLVRGSEQPIQEQGKVLLRGTQSSQELAAEKLLRGSQE